MDVPMLADQQQLIYIDSERKGDVVWKIAMDNMNRWRKREGGREGGREKVRETCAVSVT